MEENNVFDLLEYLPTQIATNSGINCALNKIINNDHITLSYTAETGNGAKQNYSFIMPRSIKKDKECYEVLGLLQGEMGKTQNGCIVFANSEPNIINKVLKWFKKEFDIPISDWKWYNKVNMQEPIDSEYKKLIEEKVINYWLTETPLKKENSHPKVIVYTNVEHKTLKKNYYGCSIIEFKNNLFSQVFKKFLKDMTYRVHYEKEDNIRNFMRGLIAAEGCIFDHNKSKHKAVYVTAVQEEEREIYVNCFLMLTIDCKNYKNCKDLVISKRENLVQLLKQGLITMHKRKYAKFLNMMHKYSEITEETGYFNKKQIKYNQKYTQEHLGEIQKLYDSGLTNSREISEKTGIHILKIQRVLKENNLGKRLVKNSEILRKEIADYTKNNPKLNVEKIAKQFNVSKSVVVRSHKKYYGNRGMKANCKIPEEKIQKIIEIYNTNPAVKYKQVMKDVGVSSTVINKVRIENTLMRYGFKHLIGNNNKKYKQINSLY